MNQEELEQITLAALEKMEEIIARPIDIADLNLIDGETA